MKSVNKQRCNKNITRSLVQYSFINHVINFKTYSSQRKYKSEVKHRKMDFNPFNDYEAHEDYSNHTIHISPAINITSEFQG